MKKRTAKNKNYGDITIPIVTLLLSAFGVLMVYSASFYTAKTQYGDGFFFAKKQLIGFVIGTVAMFSVGKIDLKRLKGKAFRYTVYLCSLVLLAFVFVPGLGVSNYGATRWIGIGGVTVQPSEFAKYAFVLFSAGYMSENMEKMRTFLGVMPVLFSGGAVCLLIMLEPNMSVTMCVGAVMLGMVFLGGAKMKTFFVIGLPILVAVPVLILIEPYRLLRLSAFLDPWASPKNEGYQLIQSLYALGNGGWFGRGLFRSRQKYRFLPFAESDFILSVIGEEFGFTGVAVLFSISFFLIYKGIKTAARAEDFYSYLLACGITLIYGVQTLINALVVSGSIPPTGLPLPLVSSGNTSLVVTMTSMGLLYRISKGNKEKEKFIQ
ncbi:MAG: putative lipid II flippase FtsW [Clostridia bacterium]|nr:putative lipid II flippase FtsW [Clostridia bacterium]